LVKRIASIMAATLLSVMAAAGHGNARAAPSNALAFVDVVPGFSALHELEYLVRAGLTPYDALRTGTVNAALALHEIDSLGTIDTGKRADLLLLDASPLTDVRNVNRRVGVLLRGRWLPESELQLRLESVARAVTNTGRR
jgi:cytosine/adenosine deaminase-related metal-dependent hydrolase